MTGRTDWVVLRAAFPPSLLCGGRQVLSDGLRKSGDYPIIASSEEDPDLEQHEVDQLLARQLDVLIIASCRSTAELVVRIQNHKTPYILIDRNIPGASANYVGVDDVAVGRLATRYRIVIRMQADCAHPRAGDQSWDSPVGGIRTRAGAPENRDQLDRYITSVRKVDEANKQRGAEAMAGAPAPQAYYRTAFSAITIRWLTGRWTMPSKRGSRIPEDVAIIGCGNLHHDDSLRVGLSSID